LDEGGHVKVGEGDDYPRLLGEGEGGEPIYVNRGPYGFYVQSGKQEEGEKKVSGKVRRASFPKEWGDPEDCTLSQALKLLSLPRDLGEDPERGDRVVAGLGRFGPYVKSGVTYVSLTDGDSVFDIGINRAVTLIAEKRAKSGERVLGQHPSDGEDVVVTKSRFGYSLLYGGERYYLPRGMDVETMSWEEALEALEAAKLKAKSKPKAKAKKGKGKAAVKKKA
jgi:DNA topoisomerase-1